MLSKVRSATLQGLDAVTVTIEVSSSDSMQPRFVIVGLPDSAVRESSERVQSALRVGGWRHGVTSTVVNLAPADLRKEGSGFDLPIAVGALIATGHIAPESAEGCMFVGELGLDGTVLPVRGALPVALQARREKMHTLFVPEANAREAGVVSSPRVYGVSHLRDVIGVLSGRSGLKPVDVDTRGEFFAAQTTFGYDFSEVRGQIFAKRALEIAAAGGHNILMIGSPGCGKSMMAKRLPSILPPLTLEESLETTQIHSVAGKLRRDDTLIKTRPFRAPHHTVSDIALVGGGTTFMPGEISLAHNGVLFLDELPEYSRAVLETLRQPLEDHVITVSRSRYSYTLPCSFMLVASMNPCPCGYHRHPSHRCTCTPGKIMSYLGRISGPLMDRIDLQVEVDSVPFDELASLPRGETSAQIRERVVRAREVQRERFAGQPGIHCNAQMTPALMERHAPLSAETRESLGQIMRRSQYSARAYDRIIKVARTIADLAASPDIRTGHVTEAAVYRLLDHGHWA